MAMDTVDTVDRTGRVHIQPGMDVFDVDAHKIGSVVHLHERAASAGPAGAADYVVEVKTGFLGLGKHYFVPQSAVRDVTEGGVFLNAGRDAMKQSGWETRPTDLGTHAAPQETVHPTADTAAGATALEADTWEEAMPRYRTRAFEIYGTEASWQRYEPRYRFAWEMGRAADLARQPWPTAEVELRRRWEVLHPNDPWEGASETIRDAWESTPTS